MRTSITAALTICLALPTLAAEAPLWGDLETGPYKVGFKAIPMRDYTRTIRPKFDREGKRIEGERSQPIFVGVWYPAKAETGGERMTFDEYGKYHEWDQVSMTPPTAEVLERSRADLKEFFARPFNFPEGGTPSNEAWDRLFDSPLMAVRNAAAIPGSYPLIVSNNGLRMNAITNELLASHGYIVAAAGPVGHAPVVGSEGVEWSARNIEFVMDFMRESTDVDFERVGVMGFSGDGFGPVITTMRNSNVDALVAIESGIFMPQFQEQLTDHPSWGPDRIRVPYLHLFRGPASAADEDLTAFRQMRYSERYRFLIDHPRAVHQDFSIYGPASVLLGMRGDFADGALRASAAISMQIVHFFDAFVKRNEASRSLLVRDDADATVERIAAIKRAPNQNEARTWFAELGPELAVQRLMQSKEEDPQAGIFSNGGLGALGYSFIAERNLPAAKAVAALLERQAPNTVYAHNMTGNLHMTEGRKAEAVAEFEKAVLALTKATAMSERERELSRVNIQTKIDRLKKEL